MTEKAKPEDYDWSVRVEVFKGEEHEPGWPKENILAFNKWLSRMIDKIPEQHRRKAVIDISSHSFYDSDYATIEIYYDRKPTRAEMVARMKDDREKAERAVLEAEKQLAIAKARAR